MAKLKREDLWSLEKYSEKRAEFRKKVLEHKKHRGIPLGEHATLYFENELTMRYQIQEMLRIEKIFDAEGINEELGAYNPLIPDGSNWKATFMIEYGDAEERAKILATLGGIEDKVWVQVDGLIKSTLLPMKIWNVVLKKKHQPFILCVLNYRLICQQQLKIIKIFQWELIMMDLNSW